MKNIFESLNSEQQKAVSEVEKPLLIIDGAWFRQDPDGSKQKSRPK